MEYSTNLSLPFIMPSQAQKHVTHNEALRVIDALVQLSVASTDLTAPPADPADGERHIVGSGAIGDWAGHDDDVAAFQDGAWAFHAPADGWIAWDMSAARLLSWTGTAWIDAGAAMVNPAEMVGINTTADATNRLAVKTDAALFSHDDVTPGSGDTQLKLNKAADSATASFLFQTDYSGRAEIGLTGDDKLHIKTSADGSTWRDNAVFYDERLVVGADQAYDVHYGVITPIFQTNSPAANAGMAAVNWGDDNSQSNFHFAKSRGGAVGAHSNLQDGDGIGGFHWTGSDGTTFVPGASIRVQVEGTPATDTMPARILLMTSNGTTGPAVVERFRIQSDGTTRPGADNTYDLGAAPYRWANIYAANGTIQTSDIRDKDLVGDLCFAGTMIDAVSPVLFRWKVGSYGMVASTTETISDADGIEVPKVDQMPRGGVRIHAGFLAQDLKSAMDNAGVDFGAWGLSDRDDLNSRQWTRPDQLVAVLWAALRETREEITKLKSTISDR